VMTQSCMVQKLNGIVPELNCHQNLNLPFRIFSVVAMDAELAVALSKPLCVE